MSEELGLRVDRWVEYDGAGKVHGYPSNVEINVAIKDEKVILIEVSSHVRASDVLIFKRKAEFYEEKTKRRPDKLLMITPYAGESVYKASRELGIEIYTKV